MSFVDPAKVSPDFYKLLHEDEHSRVLELHLPAGASDVEHALVFRSPLGRRRVRSRQEPGRNDIGNGQHGPRTVL